MHTLEWHRQSTYSSRCLFINLLTTNDAIWHYLILATYTSSVSEIHFEDRFCASTYSWMGWGEWASALYMAAALTGFRMALVSTGWTSSHLASTNRYRNNSALLVGTPFLVPWVLFSQAEHLLVRKSWKLAKECVWSRSWTPHTGSQKPWFKFPVLQAEAEKRAK